MCIAKVCIEGRGIKGGKEAKCRQICSGYLLDRHKRGAARRATPCMEKAWTTNQNGPGSCAELQFGLCEGSSALKVDLPNFTGRIKTSCFVIACRVAALKALLSCERATGSQPPALEPGNHRKAMKRPGWLLADATRLGQPLFARIKVLLAVLQDLPVSTISKLSSSYLARTIYNTAPPVDEVNGMQGRGHVLAGPRQGRAASIGRFE